MHKTYCINELDYYNKKEFMKQLKKMEDTR